MADHPVKTWLGGKKVTVGKHALLSLAEVPGARAKVMPRLRDIVKSHYVDPKITEQRIKDLGAPATAKLLAAEIPLTKTARSGDVGEIVATEIAEQHLGFKVPIRRLRWKDGRNMALRGDDIVGVKGDGKDIAFLKGESKSRVALGSADITAASDALGQNRGRPNRHSVLFVATRLRERGDQAGAIALELATARGFSGATIEHLLFTVSGNDGTKMLTEHLSSKSKTRRTRHAVGVRIEGHAAFIKSLYEGS